MSYNGSGTFVINSAGQPVVTGTVISSTAFNALTGDLATGLSTAITKDGQTVVTANIPFAGFRLTGVGAGLAATDAARVDQLRSGAGSTLGTVAGTNTITAVASPVITAYAANQRFVFTPANTNTSATTINIDGLGAKNVFCNNAACVGGELVQNVPVEITYDGTQFQVLATGAVVTKTSTQTLTNKTLDSLRTPTLLTSYQWDSWNPSNVAGASTNAPGTGTENESAYSTTANSSGTVTFTFVTAGAYLVTITGSTSHANTYTYDRMIMNLGGTATRRFGNSTPANSGDAGNSANMSFSISFYVLATANQTLTILPTFEVVGSGTTAQHTAYANATALFCGT